MDSQPQCPGEPYTITDLICRARRAKAYEKCPACPHRERATAMPETVRAAAPLPVGGPVLPEGGFGRELEPARAPSSPRLRLPRAAAGLGLGAAALHQSSGAEGLAALVRRIYHYF